MASFFRILALAKILSPRGLFYLFRSLIRDGANVGALVRVGGALYGDQKAIIGDKSITYRELDAKVDRTARYFQNKFNVSQRSRVGVCGENRVGTVAAIFALGRLGAEVFLLDGELFGRDIKKYYERYNLSFVVCDSLEGINSGVSAVSFEIMSQSVKDEQFSFGSISRGGFGRLTVLTSGTTGDSKAASRKTGIGAFLPAFVSLLTRLRLVEYKKVYIATPIHHGFGIATLCMSLAMGNESYLLPKFDSKKACDLIKTNRIEAVTLVPTILSRLLDQDKNALKTLKCVITGGAALSDQLALRAMDCFGDVLFNLYGTSEGGVAMLCDSAGLRDNPNSVGKPLAGVKVRITEPDFNGIGELEVRSKWAVGGGWIKTGDRASCKNSYWFLQGRVDDMIISGGVNVYPIELEKQLLTHQAVEEIAVIGVADDDFGQRLKAFIVPRMGVELDTEEIKTWISQNCAKQLMPRDIEIVENLPYNAAGKIDKKRLVNL